MNLQLGDELFIHESVRSGKCTIFRSVYLLGELCGLHLCLDNLQSHNLTCWLAVLISLRSMADGKTT